MLLRLQKIRWKNFLSTGNIFTEVDLENDGTTFITGKNGSGKSSLCDALFFALFNRAYRNINKPQLVNSINQKCMLVEIEFHINNKQYLIRRGLKPSIFEIWENGNLLNQDSDSRNYQDYLEKYILKLNFKSATQLIVLGSASFVPFMQLRPLERRPIIEDLLDIEDFSKMNAICKIDRDTNRDNLQEVQQDIRVVSEKIKVIEKSIKEQKKNVHEIIEQKQKSLEGYKDIISAFKQNRETLLLNVTDHDSIVKKLESINNNLSNLLLAHKQIIQKKSTAEKQLVFYSENDQCPTCKQVIHESFKCEVVDQKQSKIEEYDILYNECQAEIDKINIKKNDITIKLKAIKETESQIADIDRNIQFNENCIKHVSKDIEDLKKQETFIDTQDLEKLQQQLIALEKSKEKLLYTKKIIEMSLFLLKDEGIKAQIIKRYIPKINKHINDYLKVMNFFIEFEINENFDEVIKSRHRDVFSYNNFSEGQKTRIDLALLFTWRDITRMRNSTHCNILILDEIFDRALDNEGIDDLFAILNKIEKESSVFIISPKSDVYRDKFKRIIRFELIKNFSVMQDD